MTQPRLRPVWPALEPGWRPPTWRQSGLLLLAGFLVLFARLPRLLLQGRVVAEEGTTYLRYAWNATPLQALLAPHQGYYSLLDNVCALIAARLLPLAATALFFTWAAAALQLLVLFLLIQCEALRTPTQRWVAVLAVLLTTPNFEIWLTLECCQWLMPVAAAIILISSTRRFFALRAATLALGALTSVTTVPLIPFFWLRVWRERTRRAAAFALCLTLPGIMQSAILLHAMRVHDRPVSPHQLRALAAFASSRMFFLTFGTGRTALLFDSLFFHHTTAAWQLALYCISAGLAFAGLAFFWRASRAALLLYCLALFLALFNWYGCAACTFGNLMESPGGEGRYFYPSNALLLIALLLATSSYIKPLSRTAAFLLAWLMATGALQYVRMRLYLNDYPAWLPQVRRWQADEREPIIIAPSFWSATPLHLPHQHPDLANLPADAYDSTSHPSAVQ